jgi:hypothetical protein
MTSTSPLLTTPPLPALLAARVGGGDDPEHESEVAARTIASHVLRRVATDPFFVGYAMAEVARRDGLDIDGLARRLGCSIACLPRLALYHRPERITNRFGEQVMRIADRTGADPVALATLLLEV